MTIDRASLTSLVKTSRLFFSLIHPLRRQSSFVHSLASFAPTTEISHFSDLSTQSPSLIMSAALEAKMNEIGIQAITIAKEDWLNSQCKSMENNLKVSGVHYRVKEFQKKNAHGKREWRAAMLRRIFIDTNVLEENDLFEAKAGGKKELKRVIRDMHPLGGKDKSASVGPTLIVALLESSLANEIKERVRKDEGLQLVKPKRHQEAESIRINSHLPSILECLRNECLRERRVKISAGGSTRYICHESLKWPWISLIAVDDDKKTPIPFKVEDPRLVDPARTLATNHIRGVRQFTPFRLLSAKEKKELGPPKMTLVHNPNSSTPEAMDDDK